MHKTSLRPSGKAKRTKCLPKTWCKEGTYWYYTCCISVTSREIITEIAGKLKRGQNPKRSWELILYHLHFKCHFDRSYNLHIWRKKWNFSTKGNVKKNNKGELFRGLTLNMRTRKNATSPENPIWIMVSVIGNGKLKYLWERTHCNKIQIVILQQIGH